MLLQNNSMCPLGHQWEEISTFPSTAPPEEGVGCDEVLQAEQAS